MNLCRLVVPVVVLLIAVDTCAAQDRSPRDEAAVQEVQRLQGTWQCEALTEDGKRALAAEFSNRTIFFGGDTFLVRQEEKLVHTAAYKLDPTKSPKTINALVSEGRRKGDIMLGIYELQGDTLKVCLDVEGEKRPTEFKSVPGSRLSFAVYRRRKAVTNEIPDIRGRYQAESTQLDGSKYVANVLIERRGDAYLLTYSQKNAVSYIGIGIRTGNTLAVCWGNQGQAGITVYQIGKGPKLIGQYTELAGIGWLYQETLTAEEKENK